MDIKIGATKDGGGRITAAFAGASLPVRRSPGIWGMLGADYLGLLRPEECESGRLDVLL